ncbi:hypothetical protein [Streptomyces sp. NPDC019507]|uniref:hypothetical protein n=1 Tax=Streptomyces sp. NPDC019507 TaxID=3154689 RepID=UPI0033F93D90
MVFPPGGKLRVEVDVRPPRTERLALAGTPCGAGGNALSPADAHRTVGVRHGRGVPGVGGLRR